MAMLKQASEVEVLIRARYPIVYVTTWEEARVVSEVSSLAQKRDKKVFEWSITTGLVPVGMSLQSEKHRDAATKDPLVALDSVIEHVDPAIYIFKDFHPFLARQNITVVRRLREIAQNLKNSYKTVILIAPMMEIPPELEKDVTVVDFDLPAHGGVQRPAGPHHRRTSGRQPEDQDRTGRRGAGEARQGRARASR